MTAIASMPELYLPRKQVPTQRDRDIFLAAVTGNRTQQEVAAEFGISQPRVAQIIQKVNEWAEDATTPVRPPEIPRDESVADTACVGSGVPTEPTISPENNPDLSPEERLRLAEFLVRERLEFVYGQSLEGWRQSRADERQNVVRHIGDKVIREERTKTQCGRAGFLNQAQRATLALARLEGVDVTGKAARKLVEQERAENAARVASEEALEPTGQETRPTAEQNDVFAAPSAESTVALPAARTTQGSDEGRIPNRPLARTPYRADFPANSETQKRRAAFLSGLSDSESRPSVPCYLPAAG